MQCKPESSLRPDVKWYKGDQELTSAPYNVEADGTLVINKVNRSRDAGEYECYAKNIFGDARAKANATIFGKNDEKFILKAQKYWHHLRATCRAAINVALPKLILFVACFTIFSRNIFLRCKK